MPGEDGAEPVPDIRSRQITPVCADRRGETGGDRISGLEAERMTTCPIRSSPRNCCCGSSDPAAEPKPTEDAMCPKWLHLGPIRYDLDRGEMWRAPIRCA